MKKQGTMTTSKNENAPRLQRLPYRRHLLAIGALLLALTPRCLAQSEQEQAVGAKAGVGGVVGAELDVKGQFGFTRETYDHSGQFNRSIQDPAISPFYLQLRARLFPPQ